MLELRVRNDFKRRRVDMLIIDHFKLPLGHVPFGINMHQLPRRYVLLVWRHGMHELRGEHLLGR